jgi:tetratricopeptide (TPR) repeat protein
VQSRWARPALAYEAYEAYGEGLKAYLRQEHTEATRQFERAVAADTAFTRAKLWAALSSQIAGRIIDRSYYATANSLIGTLAEARGELSRYERCLLDFVTAHGARVNSAAAYEAARCMTRVAPGSDNAKTELAMYAYRLNRPAEVIERLRELDPQRGILRYCDCYWPALTFAYHMLGDYEAELGQARQWSHEEPALEIPALAALGRLNDVAANLEAARSLPSRSHRTHGWVYGETQLAHWGALGGYFGYVAIVLRTHGHRDVARDVFDQAIAWFQSHADAVEEPRPYVARLLYESERWEAALPLIRELAEESPENTENLAALGKLAARRGDRAEALRISEELRSDRPSLHESARTLERARIAALLGDRSEAMTLLQRAIDMGVHFGFGVWVHRDMDLEPLHDYPPFQELMRPKG